LIKFNKSKDLGGKGREKLPYILDAQKPCFASGKITNLPGRMPQKLEITLKR
jgi:hypothetical protein